MDQYGKKRASKKETRKNGRKAEWKRKGRRNGKGKEGMQIIRQEREIINV